MSGIVCKVWNVSGDSQSKKCKAHLSDSVSYILNPEKTCYSIDSLNLDSKGQLLRECKYIENDLKTFEGAFVGGVNVKSNDIKSVVQEMMEVKDFYEKTDGRTALHMMISLEEYESDLSNVRKLMSLCNDVLKKLFPNNQAVYAIHTNTDNLHAHIIINSVALNGKKIHQDNNFIKQKVHAAINEAAGKYGFTKNDKWDSSLKYSKTDYVNLKTRMRKLIDDAIESSDCFDEFIDYIEDRDIGVRYGKYLSLKFPDMEKAIRTHQLGKEYTVEHIVERIITKKDDFELNEIGRYALDKDLNIYHPNISKMKKYKDMSSIEKKDVIHKLKLGRNPWREHAKRNWQLNKIANESNISYRINEYVKYYSADKTLQGALDGILEAKKAVAHEKAMIRYAKKKYKPIINLYNEMKKYEKAAYLYEYCNMSEFRAEHAKYRELTRKLKNVYGKEVFEVSQFLNECNDRELLASGQLNELSQQYLEIKRYGIKHGLIVNDKKSLLDAIEFYSDRDKFKQGIYTGGMNYVSSRDSDYVMLVTRSLYKGQNGYSIYYHIDVYDKNGEVVETITEYNGSHFDIALKDLQNKYNFHDCECFSDYKAARTYSESVSGETKVATDSQVDKNHVDITITTQLIMDENEQAIKTRVPGMWGANEGYIWIDRDNIININNNKTILTFLDREKDYEIYSADNKVIGKMKGGELYDKHYDNVDKNVRKHYEGVQKYKNSNDRKVNK